MFRLLFLGIWVFTTSIVVVYETRPVFGVKVGYQSTGKLTMYMVYLDNGVYQNSRKMLTENEFIHIASGNWPSIYNPRRINYFEQNHLSCGIIKDSISEKDYSYCIPLDSLWKIRFEKHPFDLKQGNGWSHKQFKPSPKQEIYLYQTYGVRQIDGDYFTDLNFWKLLNDVQDPNWILNYKSIE